LALWHRVARNYERLSMKVHIQIANRTVQQPAVTPMRTRLLQRQCACGGTPGLDSVCPEVPSATVHPTAPGDQTRRKSPSTVDCPCGVYRSGHPDARCAARAYAFLSPEILRKILQEHPVRVQTPVTRARKSNGPPPPASRPDSAPQNRLRLFEDGSLR
jgi:hypothetical protein